MQQGSLFAAERAKKQMESGTGRIATSIVGKEPLYKHQVVPHKYAREAQNSENPGVTTFDAPVEYSVGSPNILYGDWKILGKDMQLKALRGNNLNFSHPTNPYKMLTIPLVLGGIAYGTQE